MSIHVITPQHRQYLNDVDKRLDLFRAILERPEHTDLLKDMAQLEELKDDAVNAHVAETLIQYHKVTKTPLTSKPTAVAFYTNTIIPEYTNANGPVAKEHIDSVMLTFDRLFEHNATLAPEYLIMILKTAIAFDRVEKAFNSQKFDDFETYAKNPEEVLEYITKFQHELSKLCGMATHQLRELDLRNPEDLDLTQRAADHSTPFPDWSEMLAAGGFMSPELIIIAAPPKGGKTTFMVNLAVYYAYECGLAVYYVDTENSLEGIATRLLQRLEGIAEAELFDEMEDGREKWRLIIELANKQLPDSAGIKILEAIPRETTLDDVEYNLDLNKAKGFTPDVVIFDYLDNMKPTGKHREERHKYHELYMRTKGLCKKRQFFAFSPTQVNRLGVDAEVIDQTHMAESSFKVADADAVFGFNRTAIEIKAGVARLLPVVQRRGLNQHEAEPCYLKVESATQYIEQIDESEYLDLVKEYETEEKARNFVRGNDELPTDSLTPSVGLRLGKNNRAGLDEFTDD